jgi:hypothetical protein
MGTVLIRISLDNTTSPDQFNIDMSNISIEKIKSNSKIGSYKDFEIYENVDGYETSLFFLKNDIFSAFYKYIKTKSGNIQSKMIWNDKKYKGEWIKNKNHDK